ncbi:MAG: DUF1841 family protein [Steroidobacteraceae bacterium]
MTAFDSHSRDQLRKAYADAWRKHLANLPLTPLDTMIADVIRAHPQYHAIVGDPDAAMGFEPSALAGTDHPFLHMGLHLAVRDQVSVDGPPGVRELFLQLQARRGDGHRAEHALMEALAETLWQAQRDNRPPDEAIYLALARRRFGASGAA